MSLTPPSHLTVTPVKNPQRPKAAFTLIEMLIVMGIIAVLAGLLFPAIGMARTAAARADTKAIIGSIEAAIVLHKNMNGMYPLDHPNHDDPVGNNADLVEALAGIDRDTFGSGAKNVINDQIMDSWGNPIRYVALGGYDGALPSGSHVSENVRPDSYLLWSIGANATDEVIDGDKVFGDDITNW